VAVDDRELVIFGGCHQSPYRLNDTWRFDIHKKSWSSVLGQGDVPPARSEHTAAGGEWQSWLREHRDLSLGARDGVAFEKIDNAFETIAYFLAVSALELSACLNRRFNNQSYPACI
jgi:hypothetical protein